MGLSHALFVARVSHARVRPKKNAFSYHVYYLCLPLAALEWLKKLHLLSLERMNLFSLKARDHGIAAGEWRNWIRDLLATWNITHADGDVVLMTMPRVLGYAFNPVSFWFCLSKNGELACVVSEVHNTFGERHCYLSYHADGRMIGADDWLTSNKVFHVSPFIPIEGHYEFRFAYGEEKIGIWINHHDADGLLLTTAMTGKRQSLTDRALIYHFIRYPLVTLKVIGLIHFQAIKLLRKGIVYHRKPAPPTTEVTR